MVTEKSHTVIAGIFQKKKKCLVRLHMHVEIKDSLFRCLDFPEVTPPKLSVSSMKSIGKFSCYAYRSSSIQNGDINIEA